MASELLTSWGEYRAAVDRILALATDELCIFDPDLGELKLESGERLDELRRLLAAGKSGCLKIALRDATFFRTHCPRLNELLRIHSHLLLVSETPDSIAHLRDCMILADSRHGLIRFDQGQPRSKLVLDDPDGIAPYKRRFEEILLEGGTPISATTLGL
ncbi:MAG: hypothetical protein ACM3SV_14405 [Betaproteobacteria bacterium]